jgi:hypothetical protein
MKEDKMFLHTKSNGLPCSICIGEIIGFISADDTHTNIELKNKTIIQVDDPYDKIKNTIDLLLD